MATTFRVIVITVVAMLIGALYGSALTGAVVALAGLVAFWVYEIQRVQEWLQHPEVAPPDGYGIWGELTARIYAHQRRYRNTEQRLTANVQYLQDSFTSMRDAVVMVDVDGAIKWFNHAAQALLELRYPDDTGQMLTNLIRSPEFNYYFINGEYSAPLQYVTPADKPLHLRVEITHFGEGERLLFIRDVSAEVRMEQIRRDFVANVSHELRTPLTVISGYLGTILDNRADLPQKYHRPLEQMNQQADRMESLLKDLLWLSRIESEKREQKRESIDVKGLLHELREELSGLYLDRQLSFSLECDTPVLGDYRELYSAISNLVTNALKYSDEDSPVSIRWFLRAGSAVLEVQDRGAGIDPLLIPRLTERFFRVDDSRNSETGGTGLGLAIVKHVAEAHNAKLHIDSQVGKGSTFTLEFPLGGQ